MAILWAIALSGCAATHDLKLDPHELRLSETERSRCVKDAEGGDLIVVGGGMGLVECKEFEPQRVIRGVWYDGFEEAGFVEGVPTVPLVRTIEGHDISFRERLNMPDAINRSIRRPSIRGGCTRAIYLEFVGRKAVRTIPHELDGDEPVYKVERVLKSEYLGWITSYHHGEKLHDCR